LQLMWTQSKELLRKKSISRQCRCNIRSRHQSVKEDVVVVTNYVVCVDNVGLRRFSAFSCRRQRSHHRQPSWIFRKLKQQQSHPTFHGKLTRYVKKNSIYEEYNTGTSVYFISISSSFYFYLYFFLYLFLDSDISFKRNRYKYSHKYNLQPCLASCYIKRRNLEENCFKDIVKKNFSLLANFYIIPCYVKWIFIVDGMTTVVCVRVTFGFHQNIENIESIESIEYYEFSACNEDGVRCNREDNCYHSWDVHSHLLTICILILTTLFCFHMTVHKRGNRSSLAGEDLLRTRPRSQLESCLVRQQSGGYQRLQQGQTNEVHTPDGQCGLSNHDAERSLLIVYREEKLTCIITS